MERLQKVMADRGVASRRKCEELILAGRVRVNGERVQELGVKVDPKLAVIEVDGVAYLAKEEEKVYLLFHKPKGSITSVSDPQGRRVVLDYMKGIKERIYPVGRLDYDTEGLLILTNDGELANRLIHPKYELKKTYRALIKGTPDESALNKLRQGILLDDGLTYPAEVNLEKRGNNGDAWITLTIHEGRNRQVRRMCAAIGHPVIYLQRISLGFLNVDGVAKGKYRRLTKTEVEQLKREVGLL